MPLEYCWTIAFLVNRCHSQSLVIVRVLCARLWCRWCCILSGMPSANGRGDCNNRTLGTYLRMNYNIINNYRSSIDQILDRRFLLPVTLQTCAAAAASSSLITHIFGMVVSRSFPFAITVRRFFFARRLRLRLPTKAEQSCCTLSHLPHFQMAKHPIRTVTNINRPKMLVCWSWMALNSTRRNSKRLYSRTRKDLQIQLQYYI